MSYANDTFSIEQPPEPRSNRTCLLLSLGCGGALAGVLLCGGCCVGMVFFAMVGRAEPVQAQLEGNPILEEHVGEIVSFQTEFRATLERMQTGDQAFVFRVQGTRGSGRVIAHGVDELESARLVLETGEEFDLLPADPDVGEPMPEPAAPPQE